DRFTFANLCVTAQSLGLSRKKYVPVHMPELLMKVNLFALEKEFAPEAMAEAGDLLRQTRDFRLLETERNHFLFTSVAPDYQVEVVVKTGNQASARCDCAFYKRNNACK